MTLTVLANVGCFGMLDVMARNEDRAARQEANRQALRERWHRAEVALAGKSNRDLIQGCIEYMDDFEKCGTTPRREPSAARAAGSRRGLRPGAGEARSFGGAV